MPCRQNLATAVEVAEYMGVPLQTLAQWRYLHRGPAYVKVGRHVRYVWADVEAFLEAHTVGEARAT